MFSQKTLFIVGAGGSFEIGLPVGETLKKHIQAVLRFSEGGDWTSSHVDSGVLRAVSEIATEQGNYGPEMQQLCLAAEDVRRAMPLAISIDNYLHTHANDPRIVQMGKIGIAASILTAERKSKIYGSLHGNHYINYETAGESWHNTFCKMLTEGVQKDRLDEVFENVSFITFNYDRCIEHYVVMWLMTYMRISYEESCKICKNLRVFHPYGHVGLLPWQSPNGNGIPFGAEPDQYNILQTSRLIRTFTERVDDEVLLDRMKDEIRLAARVIYLGFSYGQMNMELLEIDRGTRKKVLGTVYQMSEANIDRVNQRIWDSMRMHGNTLATTVNLKGLTANQLLLDHWYILSE